MTLHKFSRNSVFIILIGILSSCQTIDDISSQLTSSTSSNNDSSSGGVSKSSYSIFYDQGDHLSDLEEAGNIEDAAKLYEEQQIYFAKYQKNHKDVLESLAKQLNASRVPKITQTTVALESVNWPQPAADWGATKTQLAVGKASISEYYTTKLLKNPPYTSPKTVALQETLSKLEQKILESAGSLILEFDHFGSSSFFEQYPIQVSISDGLDQQFSVLLSRLGTKEIGEILQFSKNYPRDILGDERWSVISNEFVDKRLNESDGSNDLRAMLAALNDTELAGFTPTNLGSFRFGFLEVTSRTLLDEGQLEFSAEIEVDLPVDIFEAELDTALSSSLAEESEYLFIFDVALAKTRRTISNSKKQSSKKVVGYQSVANPQHAMAQNEVTQAQMNFQTANMNHMSASSQYCYGLGCIATAITTAIAATGVSDAQESVQQAMKNLSSTPTTIEKPVFGTYQWDLTKVKSTKSMTAHYYVIDRKNKTYFKSTFDVVEHEEFEVAYNVHPDDPRHDSIVRESLTEKDVVEWEEAGSVVPLSQLVDHYLSNIADVTKLPTMENLRKAMLADRNKALASYADETFTASTQNDPRFDSVVAVLMPDGGLGSGFYVTPDIVMTNYHVVKQGDFAELRLYDGQETFGKVIARDLRLDLALLKVQARGKPVQFYEQNVLELGKTIEVIGHPRGHMFSITRGVVSAVRKMDAPVITTAKDVLQIQIDAPTSPGNSGGPVFLDDKVVSIVSWGRVDQGSENLNFTIHYAEASRFLKESLKPDS